MLILSHLNLHPWGLQEVEAPRIAGHSTQEESKVDSLHTALPQYIVLVLIHVRTWGDPTDIVRQEILCRWKVSTTQSGIETATFRLGRQCLNQLLHCVALFRTKLTFLAPVSTIDFQAEIDFRFNSRRTRLKSSIQSANCDINNQFRDGLNVSAKNCFR